MRHRKFLKGLAAASLFVALASCSTLTGTTATRIYDLTVPTSFSGSGKVRGQLLVPVPSAISALATNRIVVRDRGGEISYFPDVSWSDELPALIQSKLVRSFENSGRANAVGRPGESLAIDNQVIVDIRAFELDVSGPSAAHVSFGVKLLDDRNGHVRATKIIDVEIPAAGDSPDAAIAALDAAATQAMSDVVGFAAGTL